VAKANRKWLNKLKSKKKMKKENVCMKMKCERKYETRKKKRNEENNVKIGEKRK
jgi:hypothetical protein